MGWRGFLIAGSLLAGIVVNLALIAWESIPQPELTDELRDEYTDKLAAMAFAPTLRNSNFRDFGLSDEMVEETAQRTRRLEQRFHGRYETLIAENRAGALRTLCGATSELPQRFALLSVLVEERNGQRTVVDPNLLATLDAQPWWVDGGGSLTGAMYNKLVMQADLDSSSTAMIVGAVLVGEEQKALERQSPWGHRAFGGWSFVRMIDQHSVLRTQLVSYFALMHLLIEIANGPDGLCSADG